MRHRLAILTIIGTMGFLSLCVSHRISMKNRREVRALQEVRTEPHSSPSEIGKIDYNREIKPILSNSCYSCHGPDEGSREAGFRLDVRAEAVASAIKPRNAAASRLFAKITAVDARKRMPPQEVKKPKLTPDQIDLIRRWIDEGARYETHWAFAPPVRPYLSRASYSAWVRNVVDRFVKKGHDAHGLKPAPEADRRTLIRRLSFDVTGLPPSPVDVEQFVNDPSPNAYEQLVDRLLESPHYGERMAVAWLDLVRYADTDGYSVDDDRSVWMYRDFVIDSFNRNKHFDIFTVQQLSGDLIPSAGQEDRIGSGYNRILMNSTEGCAEPEERRARYAADRVRNVSSVWLGLTMGCAECHDHKFDPITTKEFYQLAAFFADIQETAVGQQGAAFFPNSETLKQKLYEVNVRARDLHLELRRKLSELRPAREKWEGELKRDGYKGVPEEVVAYLRVEEAQRNPAQVAELERYYSKVSPALMKLSQQFEAATTERSLLEKEAPATLVSSSGPSRVVRILPRGDWKDKSGELVAAGLPSALLGESRTNGRRASRLDLAKWLVSRENPLTARVLANRLWKIAFGKGLVASVDDFGTQGALPTHPELLDWLAVELMDRSWDIKAILKLLFTSSAYRQSAETDAAIVQRDPANTWLTRQNRFRLDAEFIRDNALAISGLLTADVGGPSVKPYQPEGYWADRFYDKNKNYQTERGANQYRRGLYTVWCRNYPHPALSLFDAPPRQTCKGDRERSATPLQALALLNDPTYAEAARAFAYRVMREAAPEQRFNRAFHLAVSRDIRTDEEVVLRSLYAEEIQRFKDDPASASHFLSIGNSPVPVDVDAIELAATTAAMRVILNLRETITRY